MHVIERECIVFIACFNINALAFKIFKEEDGKILFPTEKKTLAMKNLENLRSIPKAVKQCLGGLFVGMVTGDNMLTASYIARECGILYGNGIAIEGKSLSKEDKLTILPRDQVVTGNVVSVTGNETNDAPALKEADIGFAKAEKNRLFALDINKISSGFTNSLSKHLFN
ncbi:hypothetical protein ROZALSC1DRAFT_30750 [Rozella allomycis CSF55]|uniref:Uncharacterized protein n=1 Tax=Rozella allomycis (strain CSF55) TaxID=988480 RepID=A0A4P9YEV3_ROZAC|nr:hypothetical protein ROZALSC1DRAFT_30750 [Rozella allomycis CSF55]